MICKISSMTCRASLWKLFTLSPFCDRPSISLLSLFHPQKTMFSLIVGLQYPGLTHRADQRGAQRSALIHSTPLPQLQNLTIQSPRQLSRMLPSSASMPLTVSTASRNNESPFLRYTQSTPCLAERAIPMSSASQSSGRPKCLLASETCSCQDR